MGNDAEMPADERERLRRRIAQFVHDIRTPLIGITCSSGNTSEHLRVIADLLDACEDSAQTSLTQTLSRLADSQQTLQSLDGFTRKCNDLVDDFWADISALLQDAQTTSYVGLDSPSTHISATSTGQRRVLLVEDNEINQRVGLDMLSALGCDVLVATDGSEVLRHLDSQTFDLIFMDMRLPTLDGCATTEAIRRSANHAYIPIIGITASPDEGDKDREIAAGMDDCLTRPLTMDVLEDLVNRYTL